MLTSELAPRHGLRAFLIAAAVLFFGLSQAKADTVTLDFNNVSPGLGVKYSTDSGTNWTGTSAGQFNWTRTAGVSYLDTPVPGTNNVTTFCIELNQYTGNGITYTIYTDISGLPIPGGAMGANAAKQIQTLANGYENGTVASALNVALGFVASVDMIQAAIWNIVKEGDFSTTNGVFRVSDQGTPDATDTTWETRVNSILGWVSSNWGSYNPATANWFAVGLSNGGNQDQIDFVYKDTFEQIPPVPVPAGVILAGMGIACMGGFNYLRRRKVVAAV